MVTYRDCLAAHNALPLSQTANRAMLCKRGLCRHAVSVCPSRSCILSKRVNVSSKFFSPGDSHTILIFFHTKHHGLFRRGPSPVTRSSNAGGVGTNRDSQRISGYQIDDWWSANNNCDRPQYSSSHRPPRISESCLSQTAWTTTTKRRKEKRIYLYAAVNLKRK